MKKQRNEDTDYKVRNSRGHNKKRRADSKRLPDRRQNRIYRSRKRKRRVHRCLAILCTLVIIFGLLLAFGKHFQKISDPVSSPSAVTPGMELKNLNSTNAVLVRLDSGGKGEVLAEKNADEKIYPASLTKIMTAILAIENIEDMGQAVEVPYDIFQYLYEMDASVAGFEPGETVTAEALVYGVILESGAECCLALADFIAGSEDAYVELMNLKAKKLGMNHTNFSNTTGLQDKQHYTTVRDLAVLLEYALENPVFRQVFTSTWYTVEPTGLHPEGFTMQSTLSENLGNPEVNGGEILGGKTGYTEEAGLCLASLANVNGREYILITAHAAGSHETEPYHIDDAVNVYGQIAQ